MTHVEVPLGKAVAEPPAEADQLPAGHATEHEVARLIGESRLASPERRARLRQALDREALPDLRAQLALALARVGDADDLPRLRDLAETHRGQQRRQEHREKHEDGAAGAAFAATLLQYRLDRSGPVLPPVAESSLLRDFAHVTRWAPLAFATEEAPDAYVEAVENEVDGVRFDRESSLLLVCRGVSRLVLPVLGAHQCARSRPTLLAVVAAKDNCTGFHGLDLWVLGTPQQSGLDLQVFTVNGALAYAGHGRWSGDVCQFDLRTVEGSGLVPIVLDGQWSERGLAAGNARVAVKTTAKRGSPTPV